MQTSLFGTIEIGFALRSFVAGFAFGFVPFALAPWQGHGEVEWRGAPC